MKHRTSTSPSAGPRTASVGFKLAHVSLFVTDYLGEIERQETEPSAWANNLPMGSLFYWWDSEVFTNLSCENIYNFIVPRDCRSLV